MRRTTARLVETVLAILLTLGLTVPLVYVKVKFGWWWAVLGFVLVLLAGIAVRTAVDVRRLKRTNGK
jgi:membrane associated rhomboid family serine protease